MSENVKIVPNIQEYYKDKVIKEIVFREGMYEEICEGLRTVVKE